MKFDPIIPVGLSDRALLERTAAGINDTHHCIDSLRAEQATVNIKLTEAIGTLQTHQALANGRLETLTKVVGIEKWQPDDRRIKAKGLLGWSGWTMVGASGGMVVLYKVGEPVIEPLIRAVHHAIIALQ